tara:strand:- start:323 stop:2815 length:2493 start_codon:yes stop_codon:yes gene_type:complete
MSKLSPDELAILNMFKNEIQYVPTRDTLLKYHQYKYDPFAQYRKDKINESKRKEKKDDGYEKLGDGFKGFMLAHMLKPSHSGLTIDELEKAQLSRAGRMYYEQGIGAAEQYLMQKNNPYKIDDELSNGEGLVVTNKEGKPEMAFRGTDKGNLQDLKTDAAILFGGEAETEQFKNADNQIQTVKEKYGMLPEHYSGFSLGGAKSLHFGQKYNTRTTNFNPFMGKNLTKNIQNTSAIQKVVRTVNDPTSVGLALSNEGTHPSWRVKSILPLKKNTLNPIATHNLENLTNDDNLERSEPNALEYMAKSVESGRKLAEYQDLNTAIKAVDSGKTYAQWMYEDQTSVNDTYLKGDGTYGLKGKRHIPQSRGMRAWHDAGGSFTGEEAEYVGKLMRGIIPEDKSKVTMGLASEGQEQVSTPIEVPAGDIPPPPTYIEPMGPTPTFPKTNKTQKLQSEFNAQKFGNNPLRVDTRVRMLLALGGPSPIDSEGYVKGLYGDRKFIAPEDRAKYNSNRDLWREAYGITKKIQQQTKFQKDMDKRMKSVQETPPPEPPPTMSEDELNTRNNMIDRAIADAHKDSKSGLSQGERDTFVMEEEEDRQNILDDATTEYNDTNTRAQGMLDGMEASGMHQQFLSSIHPTNLAVGLLAGAATDKISKYTGIDKMPTVPRDLTKGAIMGGLSEKFAAGLTGRAMTARGVGLNMGAGAVSMVVGEGAKVGLEYGLDKLGANEDTRESLSDIGSGAASGATYGFMVGGAEGAAIGTAVGAVGGAAGYGLKKAGASSKTAGEVEKALDYGLGGAGIGATIGSVVPVIGTGVGAGIGFLLGEAGYGLSKLF